ncbi:MAG: Fic family protein [Candidatus Aenigmarchaeota archaeon]|nr:Fic family protein [Candidatus Aenigmarchaeota archaeon]
MVTRYDVFEAVCRGGAPLKPAEVLGTLDMPASGYKNIYRILGVLAEEGLLAKTRAGFAAGRSAKAALLHGLIEHCMRNGINYNALIDKNMAAFMHRALISGEVTQRSAGIDPKTFKKYVEVLEKYGLLLAISRKPLRVRVFYNTLANNLLVYFGFRHLPASAFKADYLTEIEKEIRLYKRLRRKNEAGYRKIVEEFRVQFIQHSLSLEGNPVTLPDTVKILKEKTLPKDISLEAVYEVKNYQAAMLRMLADAHGGRPLSKEDIIEYHRLAMLHRPEMAGLVRKADVHIKGNPSFKVAEVREIGPKLDSLMGEYGRFIARKSSLGEVLRFSARFHNEFQHIHPFTDGNSRVTRLLTFHLLHSKGVPILDIPFGLLDEYLGYTKGSRKRNDTMLYGCLQRIILFNLKRINEALRSQ